MAIIFVCFFYLFFQILLVEFCHYETCHAWCSGTYFTRAIFVPGISTYNKVTSGSSAIPLEFPSKDLTWQFNLQRVWEKIIHGKGDLR